MTAPEDLDAPCASVRQPREIGAQAVLPFEGGGRAELYLGPVVRTDVQLREYVRRTVLTYDDRGRAPAGWGSAEQLLWLTDRQFDED